jgi:hypothetical protein
MFSMRGFKPHFSLAALAAAALLLTVSAQAVASGSLPTVTVRVEGLNRTLMVAKTTNTQAADIRRGGAPSGACPGTSAQGALAVATRGKWVGKYSAKRSGYAITSIRGEIASGARHRWELFVNDVAVKGAACGVALKDGEKLLFANVPTAGAPRHPLGLTVPSSTAAGQTFHVAVVGYNAAGKATPLPGATVSVNGASGPTNHAGVVPLTPGNPGTYTIVVTKAGYIRDEATVTVR